MEKNSVKYQLKEERIRLETVESNQKVKQVVETEPVSL